MAGVIQTASSTTPGNAANWEAELNLTELSRRGYDGISLTEWAAADTDKPQIAAGGVIEINGALAKYAAQTALTDAVGLADGWCYIKHVVSGTDVVPTLTNTFGTWDTAKQGFYDGTDRYSLFAMYRSGAITKIFTNKNMLFNTQGLNNIYPSFYNMGYRTYSTVNVTAASPYTVPIGYYSIGIMLSSAASGSAYSYAVEIKDSAGNWRQVSIGSFNYGSLPMFSTATYTGASDGTNLRLTLTKTSGTGTAAATLIKLG